MTVYAGNPPDSDAALAAAVKAYIARPWYQVYSDQIFFVAVLAALLALIFIGYRIKKRMQTNSLVLLREPVNRAGFSLLIVSIGAFTMALLMAASDGDGGRFLARVLDPGQRSYDTYDYLGRYSLFGALVGAWLAWAYEPTIGRLIRWIKNG